MTHGSKCTISQITCIIGIQNWLKKSRSIWSQRCAYVIDEVLWHHGGHIGTQFDIKLRKTILLITFAKPALCAPCDSMYSMYLAKSLNSSHVGRNTIIRGIVFVSLDAIFFLWTWWNDADNYNVVCRWYRYCFWSRPQLPVFQSIINEKLLRFHCAQVKVF